MFSMFRKRVCLVSFVLVMGLVLTSAADAADPDLVAWWKLDETSGTTAQDATGNGHDGALQGDPQWVEGQLGGALEGDGSGDYVRVPHSESLSLSDAATVAVWVYRAPGAGRGMVICKGSDRDAWWSSYSMILDTALVILFRGLSTNPDKLSSNSVIPEAEWTHIAITFDVSAPGNNQKLYINGQLDAENRSENPLSTNTDDLLIGADAYPVGSTRFHWQGMLDDVRIYSRALTEAEINLVMTTGILRPPGSASNPSPANETTDVGYKVILSWKPGEFAAPTNGHKVYFGESFDDVNDATGG